MPADWADYLPEDQRQERQRLRRQLRRATQLKRRSFWLQVCAVVYGLWCLGLLFSGQALVLGLALVPLLSLPAIAALAWWLLWKEFNS